MFVVSRVTPCLENERGQWREYDINEKIFGCDISRFHIVGDIILLDIILPVKRKVPASRISAFIAFCFRI